MELGRPLAPAATAEETAAHDQQTAELARHKLGPITADDAGRGMRSGGLLSRCTGRGSGRLQRSPLRLSLAEREEISRGLAAGRPVRAIAGPGVRRRRCAGR